MYIYAIYMGKIGPWHIEEGQTEKRLTHKYLWNEMDQRQTNMNEPTDH